MRTKGNKVAVEFGVHGGLSPDYFGAATLRYVTGNVDYHPDARYASVSESDKRDYYVEARALVGRMVRCGSLDIAAPLLVNGVLVRDGNGQMFIQEPRNRTTEAGVKVVYQF